MSEQDRDNRGNEFKLERYKYILNELYSLNNNVYKYLTLYQSLATIIIGGGVTVFMCWKSLKIDADTAIVTINGLLGLLVILTLFVLISITSGMISWYDYRREEVNLLNDVVAPGYRKPPKYKNIWRWHEVYILLFIVIVTVVIFLFVRNQILPLIK